MANEARISIHYIETEANRFLEHQNLSLVHLRAHAPTEPEINRLISRVMVFEKNFEYNIPEKGPMQYFMGARSYLMLIIMSLSMLGLGSAFSRNRLDFLPFIFLALGFGIYKTITTKNQEDEEKMDKQITNAKDQIRGEIKRQLDNFVRGWQKMLDEQYTEPIQNHLRDIDRQVGDLRNNNANTALSDDRRQLDAAIGSLNTNERNNSEWQRTVLGVSSKLQNYRTDWANNIKPYLQKWT
jgi:hypothetical protein